MFVPEICGQLPIVHAHFLPRRVVVFITIFLLTYSTTLAVVLVAHSLFLLPPMSITVHRIHAWLNNGFRRVYKHRDLYDSKGKFP